MNKKIILVQPLPPPNYGPSIYTEYLIKAIEGKLDFELINVEFNSKANEIGKKPFKKIFKLFKAINEIRKIKNKNVFINLHLKFSGLLKTFFLTYFSSKNNAVIHFLHEGGLNENIYKNKLKIIILNFILKKSKLLLALDPIQLEEWKSIFPEISLDFLPAYREHSRSFLPILNRDRNILFLSNLIPEKGIFRIIDIWNNIKDKNGYKLNIIGGVTDKLILEKIKNLIANNDSIKLFVDYERSKILEIFKNSRIFVMPTTYKLEQQPAVLIEALSYGIPIIANNWRGIPFIVKDNYNGYLIDPNDINDFLFKLTNLLNDDEKLNNLSDNALIYFEENFTQENYLNKIIDII